jgi:hypothetical protein
LLLWLTVRAQVNGREELSIPQKVKFDFEFIKIQSLDQHVQDRALFGA